ncbi:hypothetical protein [Cupriavidus sp. 8B]
MSTSTLTHIDNTAGQSGSTVKFVDATPTWAEILPSLRHLLEAGKPEGIETARRELGRMAQAADRSNERARSSGYLTVQDRVGHAYFEAMPDDGSERVRRAFAAVVEELQRYGLQTANADRAEALIGAIARYVRDCEQA